MRKCIKGALVYVLFTVLFICCGCSAESFTGGASGKRFQKYINNVMEGCYYGHLDKYQEVCNATEEEARSSYENTVEYYAQQLLAFNQVDADAISEELYQKYVELARSILGEAKYIVNEGKKVNDSWQVTIEIYPVDINAMTWEALDEVIHNYNGRIEELDLEQMSEEEQNEMYAQLQEEYAENVYRMLNNYLPNLGHLPPVQRVVIVNVGEEGNYGISDSDWNDIDDMIVDMKGKF